METQGFALITRFRGLRPAPDVLSRRVGEESVLVDLTTNRIFSLNSTGARFWELLEEGLDPGSALPRLLAEFDASESELGLVEDICSFCELLERERLLSRRDG